MIDLASVNVERTCRTCGEIFLTYLRTWVCHPCGAAKTRSNANHARAIKWGSPVVGPVSASAYRTIIASGPCVYCDGEATQVDHIQPLCEGGHEAEYNLVPCCISCNSSKFACLLTRWCHQDRVAHAVANNPKVAAVWAELTGASA